MILLRSILYFPVIPAIISENVVHFYVLTEISRTHNKHYVCIFLRFKAPAPAWTGAWPALPR